MEHTKGIGNEFFPDDDFDRMLEEKTKGWQDLAHQSTTEIIAGQKITNLHIKSSAPDAEDPLSQSTKSTETGETEAPSVSSDALNVANEAETIVASFVSAVTSISSDVSVVDVSTDTEAVDTPHDNKPLQSDPAYSQHIIENRAPKVVIRGNPVGPWANKRVEVDIVSRDQALDNIGHHKLAAYWRQLAELAKDLNGDPDKIMYLIQAMQDGAYKLTSGASQLHEELKRIVREGNTEERNKAQANINTIFIDHNNRTAPDSERDAAKAARAAAKAAREAAGKDKKPKETMLVRERVTIDMFYKMKMDRDTIVKQFRDSGKLNGAILEYINGLYSGKDTKGGK